MTGIAAVLGRIQEIETAIQSFVPSAATRAATTATSPTSPTSTATSTDFASVLGSIGSDSASVTDQVAALVAPTTSAGPGSTATGEALVAEARKYLGVPYAWGGESMSGIDCSGLVQQALGALGVDMPRVARQQMTQGTPVASMADARVGDLLVFDGGSHIAIYLGDGRMIDAPKPGDVVRERDVYETPTAIRRVVPTAAEVAAQAAAASLTSSTAPAGARSSQIDQLLATSAAQRSSLSLMLGAAA